MYKKTNKIFLKFDIKKAGYKIENNKGLMYGKKYNMNDNKNAFIILLLLDTI